MESSVSDSTRGAIVANPQRARAIALDRRRFLVVRGPEQPIAVIQGAGRPGASGTSSDAHYVFTQIPPSNKWTITHNLGKFPSVIVQDSANDEVEGDIEYTSSNALIITFTSAFSGTAYLN